SAAQRAALEAFRDSASTCELLSARPRASKAAMLAALQSGDTRRAPKRRYSPRSKAAMLAALEPIPTAVQRLFSFNLTVNGAQFFRQSQ
ncbi:MAG: hypothetical protein KDI37_07510, partial [Xanthomonadales bacterium]|nr:hypothetical protein [Xanthomonadales bacterium]